MFKRCCYYLSCCFCLVCFVYLKFPLLHKKRKNLQRNPYRPNGSNAPAAAAEEPGGRSEVSTHRMAFSLAELGRLGHLELIEKDQLFAGFGCLDFVFFVCFFWFRFLFLFFLFVP